MSGALIDKYLGKFLSRKLFTFLWACGLILAGSLESSDWTMIACIYIGGQSVIDMIKAYKHG